VSQDAEAVATGVSRQGDAVATGDDDEIVPVCGATRHNYTCVRPPDHEPPSIHLGMTDRANIVQWDDEKSGVKIRPMTQAERDALAGFPTGAIEEIEGITEFAVGVLRVAPGDTVVVKAPDLNVEEANYLQESLNWWSEKNQVDLKWLVLAADAELNVLTKAGRCAAITEGMMGAFLSCELTSGHDGMHHDPTGTDWGQADHTMPVAAETMARLIEQDRGMLEGSIEFERRTDRA
jgi:hypothetical protein